METIRLSRPLLVNGEERTELLCDMDAVTPEQFIRALAYSSAKRGNEGSAVPMAEIDYGFHLYLAFAGCVAADHTVDISDLERITGIDLVKLTGIGRFFMLGVDGSSRDSSDGPSESTPTSTPAAPTKSGEDL